MSNLVSRLRHGAEGYGHNLSLLHEAAEELASMSAQHRADEKEIESLRADALRYRWLKQANPHVLTAIAWDRSKAACKFSGDQTDEAIDAAREVVPFGPLHHTDERLDEAFATAVEECGVREQLAVYTSNSFRRVGLKGSYHELMAAYCQRSDGQSDISNMKLLEALVAAFNAMLARLPARDPQNYRDALNPIDVEQAVFVVRTPKSR